VEPALGTVEDLRAVVEAAHARGMRVIMDAIINHTGPVTPLDPQWPDAWVRTGPRCDYDAYATTVPCTLVDNLPDVRTESDEPVELPDFLLAKWEAEGRLEQELAELDAFFERTGYPRAPRFYLIKWLTDWVRELGFDGYRVDTARNFDEDVALELKAEADLAFADWKAANPDRVLDDLSFYMFGEVYGWNAAAGRAFDFGDRLVDYFDYGYDGLINFGLKVPDLETAAAFSLYSDLLNGGALEGVSILSYLDSHDDSSPWDPLRQEPKDAAVRLLLAPGGAQIYYGDELARPLLIPGATTDANLRSFMPWEGVEQSVGRELLLEHWRKLGRFRHDHPAVGAGKHVEHQATPYVFSRVLDLGDGADRVLVGIDMPPGPKVVPVFGVFPEGAGLVDAYSGEEAVVSGGEVELSGNFDIVLLEERVTEPSPGGS
jgi:alpha-amylase